MLPLSTVCLIVVGRGVLVYMATVYRLLLAIAICISACSNRKPPEIYPEYFSIHTEIFV